MKKFQLFYLFLLCLLLVSFILFSSCEKKEDVFIEEEPDKVTAEAPIPDEQSIQDRSERDENIDKFLNWVLEKEKELEEKEEILLNKLADLEEKQAQLKELESDLIKAELKFNDFRLLTYVILFIGLACIISGLIMIVFRGKPKKATPEPEAKPGKKVLKKEALKSVADTKARKKEPLKSVPETKAPKKEPSKSAPETKAPKKESPKPVAKPRKTKTGKKSKE